MIRHNPDNCQSSSTHHFTSESGEDTSTPSSDLDTPDFQDAYTAWESQGPEQQLGEILRGFPALDWIKEPALSVLARFRRRPIQWAEIVLTWRERAPFQKAKLLEDAIDDWLRQLGSADHPNAPRQSGTPSQASTDIPPGDWQSFLLCTKDGEPKQTVNNISLLLEHAAPWREDWWFDTVRGVAMVGENPLDDTLITLIARWLGDEARMSVQNLKLVGSCCVALCQHHPRDLLKEWLSQLPQWDGTERLTSWLHGIAGSPDTPYVRDVSCLLPVSMVARALDPGCRYRQAVLLEGEENTGKSTLVRVLASPEWFYECTGGLEGKEAYMAIQGKWVAELPELHAMTKTEENRFKGFITQVDDTWVPNTSVG